ncbi:MAG: acylphosphatase [Candidatus Nanoarchaeia archaeon]|nr:acylphosphatase [Candidatus Nanoarchaeia archaeon]
MKKRVRITIKGRVHGVGFRYSTLMQARKLGLTGFARNLSNGDVEVVAEGEDENLQKLVDFCREGPSMANVTSLDYDYSNYKKEFNNFRTR